MREGRGRLSGGREGQHNIFNLTQRHEAPPPQNLLLGRARAGRVLCLRGERGGLMLKSQHRQWLNALTFRDEPFP